MPRLRDAVHLGIVTPMANEEATCLAFVSSALAHASSCARVTVFVVLDHASRDGTRALLEAHARSEPRLVVAWAPHARCLVDAYVHGLRAALDAGCDWILEIDGGFSHDPAHIPRHLAAMDDGLDCAFGSRFVPGAALIDVPRYRRVLSRGGTWVANALLGSRMRDMTSGFEMFSREALTELLARPLHSTAHMFQTELRARCRHLRYREVPISYTRPSPSVRGRYLANAFAVLLRLVWMRLEGSLPTTRRRRRRRADRRGGPAGP